MITFLKRIFILLWLLLLAQYVHSQNTTNLYQENHLCHANNGFYTYGIKWLNASHSNESDNAYEHKSDFNISKYNPNGKKLWELPIDKKRHFISSSEIHRKGSALFCLVAFRNSTALTTNISHYLISFDTLGSLVQELKLKDSTTSLYNGIFFGNELIVVTRSINKTGVVSETYDYKFNLLGRSADPAITAFYFDSRVFHSGAYLVSAGACTDMTDENKLIAGNRMSSLYTPKSFGVKKTTMGQNKYTVTKATLLPQTESINHVFGGTTGEIYITTLNFSQDSKKPTKRPKISLYCYDVEREELRLLADTFSVLPIFLKPLSKNEFVYVSQQAVDHRGSPSVFTPNALYRIKDNKRVSYKILKTAMVLRVKNEFVVEDNKLFVYELNHDGSDIDIKVYDYTDGKEIE